MILSNIHWLLIAPGVVALIYELFFRPYYRIVYDPALGYCPQIYKRGEWRVIDADGKIGISAANPRLLHDTWRDCWFERSDDALNRINEVRGDRHQHVIWKGR